MGGRAYNPAFRLRCQPRRRPREHSHERPACCRHRPTASTTLATSTTPAASRWSPGSTTSPTTRSSRRALTALDNLEHRGAEGADTDTGDGAGILVQLPDAFFRAVVRLRAAAGRRSTASACASCRTTRRRRRKLEQLLELNVRVEGQSVLGWRDVPGRRGRTSATPPTARRPHMRQLFIGAGAGLRATTRTRSSASST